MWGSEAKPPRLMKAWAVTPVNIGAGEAGRDGLVPHFAYALDFLGALGGQISRRVDPGGRGALEKMLNPLQAASMSLTHTSVMVAISRVRLRAKVRGESQAKEPPADWRKCTPSAGHSGLGRWDLWEPCAMHQPTGK